MEAVVGVASLDLLEHALDQILRFDMPCLAVPLLEPATDSVHKRKNGAASVAGDSDAAGALFDAD